MAKVGDTWKRYLNALARIITKSIPEGGKHYLVYMSPSQFGIYPCILECPMEITIKRSNSMPLYKGKDIEAKREPSCGCMIKHYPVKP